MMVQYELFTDTDPDPWMLNTSLFLLLSHIKPLFPELTIVVRTARELRKILSMISTTYPAVLVHFGGW